MSESSVVSKKRKCPTATRKPKGSRSFLHCSFYILQRKFRKEKRAILLTSLERRALISDSQSFSVRIKRILQ